MCGDKRYLRKPTLRSPFVPVEPEDAKMCVLVIFTKEIFKMSAWMLQIYLATREHERQSPWLLLSYETVIWILNGFLGYWHPNQYIRFIKYGPGNLLGWKWTCNFVGKFYKFFNMNGNLSYRKVAIFK